MLTRLAVERSHRAVERWQIYASIEVPCLLSNAASTFNGKHSLQFPMDGVRVLLTK